MKTPSIDELTKILSHERQAYVWHQRHCVMPPRSQLDIANEMGINRPRVGQLEKAAAKKLRDPLTWIAANEIAEAKERAQHPFITLNWDAIRNEGTKRCMRWLDQWDARISCSLLGCYMDRAYMPSQETCPNITDCRIGTRLRQRNPPVPAPTPPGTQDTSSLT